MAKQQNDHPDVLSDEAGAAKAYSCSNSTHRASGIRDKTLNTVTDTPHVLTALSGTPNSFTPVRALSSGSPNAEPALAVAQVREGGDSSLPPGGAAWLPRTGMGQ